MKRLLTLLFFALFAISAQAQTVPDLPSGSVPFGTGLFRAPDGDIWGGSQFDGYVNLGNWQRVADSLGAKINWSDTTIIASKEWVEGKLNSLPPSGVLSVTGDGVDNTDPANPVLSYPDPSDIGALAPGDDVSELTNDAGYLTGETDPVYSGDPASSITQNDIDEWDAKQDAITGAATTVVSSNLTPSRALISNGSGKIAVSPVSAAELAFLDGVTSNVQDQLDAKIPLAQKGASNGVAPIGSDGKIPGEYLPSSGSYKGTWDASTNTPTIADGVGTNGDRYRVSVGGTVDLGSGPITFVAGDDVIYNGTVWQRSPSGVTVTSVAGKTGDVVLDKNDVGLGNVDNTSDLDKPISNDTQDALDGKEDAFSKGNLVAGIGITASGTLSSRLVGSGNVTFNFDQSWGDSRYALISSIPPAQTLSLGSLSGEISISGGNSVRLNSLYRGDMFSGDISELSGGGGLYTLHVTSGATGFPSGLGSAIYFSRGTSPGTSGSFMLFAPTGNTNKMYYTTGGSGQTWLPFQTFASEEWVSNNYYTKTNLQTSGQAAVHWDNITNVPGDLGKQTLSLSSSAGRISISGGNAVDLASVAAKDYSGPFEDFNPDIGLWVYRLIGGSTGYPSATGGGIRFNRNGTDNSGAFDIFKAQGTSPKLYYSVGLNGPWAQYTFASEEFTAANYFSTTPATQGGGIQNIGTNDVFGVTNAGVFRSLAGSTNAPNSTNSFSYLNLYGGSTATAMLAFSIGGSGYGSSAPYYNNRPGAQDWVQLASVPWTLSHIESELDGFLKLSSASSQEVTGPVVFSGNPQVPLTPASSNSAIAKGYLDNTLTSYALDNSVVKLTGNQNIFGEKTFEGTVRHYGGLILENEPISDKMAATKKYVDDAIAGIDIEGTDLGITGTTGARTITSSTGTGAVIPLATTSVSGLMSPSDKQTMVTTNTDQTITGAKTFTSTVRVTGVSSFGDGLNLVAGSNGAGGFAVLGGDTTRAAAFDDHGGFYIGYGTGVPGQVNVSRMQIHLPTGETTFNGDVKATEFYRTSTRKIKKDIAPFSENATSILNGVDVVEYKLKKGPDYKKIGFIAEDTHEYLSTPEHNVMDQGSSIGLLIKAVQELSAKVEELERRLAECQE